MMNKLFAYLIIAVTTPLFRLRWLYFHIHPGYEKCWYDKDTPFFFREATNTMHTDLNWSRIMKDDE